MSAAPPRLPALRVKLPCADEKDFFARLAATVAEKGLRVPTPNLRPVCSSRAAGSPPESAASPRPVVAPVTFTKRSSPPATFRSVSIFWRKRC